MAEPETQDYQPRWRELCDDIGIKYHIRPISRALMSLCVFHDEKTPSLRMYPSGNFICNGCGQNGNIDGFADTLMPGVDINDHDAVRQAAAEIVAASKARDQAWAELIDRQGLPF